MELKNLIVTAALAAGLVGVTHAVTLEWSGDTTGGPTFDRPVETFDFLPVPGQGVNYNAYLFVVDTSGDYDFQSVASGGWDNFTLLYAPTFDPGASLMNGLVGNDDNPTFGLSGFTWNLSTGVTYTLVTTGLEAGFDFGAYTNTISGPGVIAQVPEPQAWLLMALGLAAIFRLRRNVAQKG